MVIWINALSLSIIILTYIIYSCIIGCKLVYEGAHPKKSKTLCFDNIPFQYNRFQFHSKDGLHLAAIEILPNQVPKGTIIACHYLGGSKTSIYTYYEPLLHSGYRIVGFDYPNHGESGTRKGNTYTLEDDMKRFIQVLKERNIPGPYGTFGFSMGATIAISAVDTLPEIKAVVTDSGPLIMVSDYFTYVLQNKKIKNKITRIIFLFLYLYVIGFYKMSKRMITRLKRIKGIPILMIHSETDKVISYKNAQYTFDLVKSENAERLISKKAQHLTNRVIFGEKYDQTVIQFFDKWLVNDESTKTENTKNSNP